MKITWKSSEGNQEDYCCTTVQFITSMTKSVKIALDWMPNGNHVGFYVAKAKGMYLNAGFDVSFISPHSDNYKSTPASRVDSGEAIFALAPSESCISHNLRPPHHPKPALKAVAAVLQSDDSAIVTLKSSGIDRPAKLDGMRYASYSARFEGRIIQQMIRKDGGTGDYIELSLPMLGLWETVLKGEADCTWVFMGWEGVEAEQQGIELNVFKLEDYGCSYGYSPVVLAHPDALATKAGDIRALLSATAQGYEWAAQNIDEAAQLMADVVNKDHPDLPKKMDMNVLKKSIGIVSKTCLNTSGTWGVMEASKWNAFLDWLSENGLLTSKIQSRGEAGEETSSLDGLRQGDVGEKIPRDTVKSSMLFTNDYLP